MGRKFDPRRGGQNVRFSTVSRRATRRAVPERHHSVCAVHCSQASDHLARGHHVHDVHFDVRRGWNALYDRRAAQQSGWLVGGDGGLISQVSMNRASQSNLLAKRQPARWLERPSPEPGRGGGGMVLRATVGDVMVKGPTVLAGSGISRL